MKIDLSKDEMMHLFVMARTVTKYPTVFYKGDSDANVLIPLIDAKLKLLEALNSLEEEEKFELQA